MSTIQKVALAGASGAVGKPVLHELIAAGFDVTVLTRQDSKATFPGHVKVVKADYENVESLTNALKGQDAFVSTVGSAAISSQKKYIDAAIAAGVKRFLPSEYGCDDSVQAVASLPMYGPKTDVQAYLKQKTAGTATSYSLVYTNAFWDWGLNSGVVLNLKNKAVTLYDGGEFEIITTPLDYVGRAVAAILKHPQETANREVRIEGGRISQKEALSIAQKFLGAEGWTVQTVSTADMEKQSMENFAKNPADVYSWIIGMVVRAQFGEGYSRTYKSDNAVLGLKPLSKDEMAEYIKRAVDTGSAVKQY